MILGAVTCHEQQKKNDQQIPRVKVLGQKLAQKTAHTAALLAGRLPVTVFFRF